MNRARMSGLASTSQADSQPNIVRTYRWGVGPARPCGFFLPRAILYFLLVPAQQPSITALAKGLLKYMVYGYPLIDY